MDEERGNKSVCIFPSYVMAKVKNIGKKTRKLWVKAMLNENFDFKDNSYSIGP